MDGHSGQDGEGGQNGQGDTPARARRDLSRVRVIQAAALDWLGRLNPRQASKALQAEHGIARRTADRYISHALAQVCADTLTEPPEAKKARAQLRAEKLYGLALARTRTAMKEKTPEGAIVYEEVPDPDVRSGVQVNAQLMQIDALIPPTFKPGAPPTPVPQLASGEKP